MANKNDVPFYPDCYVEVRTDDKKSFQTDSCVLILSTRIPIELAAQDGQSIVDALVQATAKVVADRG